MNSEDQRHWEDQISGSGDLMEETKAALLATQWGLRKIKEIKPEAAGLKMRRWARRSSIRGETRAMIGNIDAHGDAEEFSALYAALMADGRGDDGDDREENVREAFKIFDRDETGSSRRMS
ncbi:Calmodulin-like protein 5 [Striga hermonthica]|uniref:Calmodulin-like protein 5 n=1 Tax=Striga hermonthica TaxID=68872 RepID=A0A9N7NL40_STRHE|nr:Calmodulin-like protein 5 [Striga hermonthica]